MERVHRSDLTVDHSVPVPAHEGPGPPAGPGEERPRGGGGGAAALPQPGAQHGGGGEDRVLRAGEGGANPLYWRIIVGSSDHTNIVSLYLSAPLLH